MDSIRKMVIMICFLGPVACSKQGTPNPNAQPSPGDISTLVTLQTNQPGSHIPLDFTGLSFETSALTDSSYFNVSNSSFIRFIKTLGTGLIRIGGNSSDKTFWTGQPRTAATGNDSIASSDIDRFFAFTGQTGWKIMFGLNLGTGTAGAAQSEAQYVSTIAGNQLSYFEIGNEPDLYSGNGLRSSLYNYSDFENEFNNYYQAIISTLPNAPFSGPTAADNTTHWVIPFAADEFSKIGLLTQHYYRMGPPSDPTVTITKLLTTDPSLASTAKSLNSAAQAHGLGYRIAECNSVYDGGKTGVSNTLASALWGLDFMFSLAENADGGVNFHGGGTGEYTPIAYENGQFSARPLYYGMLMFSLGSKGRLIPLALSENLSGNLDAYSVLADNGDLLVTLINKSADQEVFAQLDASKTASSTSIIRLTGPSLNAESGISLGGGIVNANGEWSSEQSENAALVGGLYTLKIPAGSAALVTLH